MLNVALVSEFMAVPILIVNTELANVQEVIVIEMD